MGGVLPLVQQPTSGAAQQLAHQTAFFPLSGSHPLGPSQSLGEAPRLELLSGSHESLIERAQNRTNSQQINSSRGSRLSSQLEITHIEENLGVTLGNSNSSSSSYSSDSTDSSGNGQQNDVEPLNLCRSNRRHQPPKKLKDYIYHTVRSNPSISLSLSPASPSLSDPTGTCLYPLTHYVSYEKFLPSHQNFVVAVNTGIKPTTYSEAAPVPE